MAVADPTQASPVSMVLEVASALLGISGTYLMSRRYTRSLVVFLFFTLVTPLMFIIGKGKEVHDYYHSRMLANKNVPIANSRMVVGLSLLAWAFFLQLLLVFIV